MSHVLLIEPDRVLAADYKLALSSAGHKVVWRASGQAAVEAADKQTPDLIILELQLPAHNGLEFLYEFRSYLEWQSIPVIVQSVVPSQILIEAGAWKLLGISKYLYKPHARLKDLVMAVEEVLQTVVA